MARRADPQAGCFAGSIYEVSEHSGGRLASHPTPTVVCGATGRERPCVERDAQLHQHLLRHLRVCALILSIYGVAWPLTVSALGQQQQVLPGADDPERIGVSGIP